VSTCPTTDASCVVCVVLVVEEEVLAVVVLLTVDDREEEGGRRKKQEEGGRTKVVEDHHWRDGSSSCGSVVPTNLVSHHSQFRSSGNPGHAGKGPRRMHTYIYDTVYLPL
jgi:hypothetical protein